MISSSPSSSNEQFYTTDTALAAYLQSEGFVITNIDTSNPHRFVFLFGDDNPRLAKFARAFEIGKAEGNIPVFFSCYKRLLFRVKSGGI